jgi:amino acid transporter
MTVAAANKNWLPHPLALVGRFRAQSDPDGNHSNATKSSDSDAPLNALLLSTILSTMYIIFGNFRALLTFNGLGEYSFFFLTALSAIILRFREPDLQRPYRPFVVIPAIFVVVSGFVVARGAVFAPVQSAILIALWVIGTGFYYIMRYYEVSNDHSTHIDLAHVASHVLVFQKLEG